MSQSKFRDIAAERTLVGTIIRHGKDALMDAQAYLSAKDFALPVNRAIFTCLEQLVEDPSCKQFDIEAIQLKSKDLKLDSYLSGKKEQEYLELLPECNLSTENIPLFALRIRKFSIVRDLWQRYQDAQNYLSSLKGNEELGEIIKNAESTVINYINGSEDDRSLVSLCDDVVEQVIYKMENEEVDQVGIPTGFTKYDHAIGGGQRKGTVNVIAARPKVSKSFLALNIGRNVAKRKIPVLYLDTEMIKKAQQDRLVSIESGCPLYKYETRQFKKDENLTHKVLQAGHELQTMPFHYQSIAGLSHAEALITARRWLVKHVGFNEKGDANDCLIIYDYLKLTSPDQIADNMKEYQSLGFLLTDLCTFAVKYKVPILGFVQLNRDGIDNTDSSIISQSDRILWLCSSMAILRNKTEDDESFQCGFDYGNKKLSILETRYGAGFPFESDYLNLKCSLRPKISEQTATGLIEEGELFSTIVGRRQ